MKLVGGGFGGSIGLAGENEGQHPASFRWDRGPTTERDTVFFTDTHVTGHGWHPAARRVALLVESPAIRPGLYDWAAEHMAEFDAVLSHQKRLVDLGARYYPLGGSRIRDWDVYPKSAMTSVLLSEKTGQEGHRLRHQVAKLPCLDAWGSGVGAYVDSWVALRNYRFSVVVENTRAAWYFSEKLVDCLSQGTVPLYWGCPGVERFFDARGLILWETVAELEAVVRNLTVADYERRLPAVWTNHAIAKLYRCPEDWMHATYKDLFDG